MTTNYIRSTG